jgi:ferredoxin
MRIHADRDRCVGGGMCALTAPNLFDQDDEEGRVVLLAKGELTDIELAAARKAVALCPSSALSLHSDSDDTAADDSRIMKA